MSDCQAPEALSFAIGGSGTEYQPPTFLGAYGCEWNPFLNSLNTNFNSFGAHCGTAACDPVKIVPVGNSRRGASTNDTGACHLAHIGGIGHEHQNVRLYLLLLYKSAEM